MFFFYLTLFLFGVGFGSFFNVVSMRYREDTFLFSRRAVGGRSHCPHCKHTLRWYELIPLLSFLLQGGKCRKCRANLSLQYPLVEFFAGLLFLAAPYYFLERAGGVFGGFPDMTGTIAAIVIWEIALMLLFLLSVIDFREYLIPDEITYALFFLGAGWVIFLQAVGAQNISFIGAYAPLFGLAGSVLLNHLAALLFGALFIGIIFVASQGRAIGFGDVKLLAVLGLLFGWPDILLITTLAFVLGALVSLPLLLRRKKTMKDFVPFAPFIAFAAFLVFLFGADMMNTYLSAFLT